MDRANQPKLILYSSVFNPWLRHALAWEFLSCCVKTKRVLSGPIGRR